MQFVDFRDAITKHFQSWKNQQMYVVDLEKDLMWEHYIKSFPEGTNPIFGERSQHECNTCKSFIRQMGNVVIVKDNKLVSIWDVQVGGFYQVVADAMAALVKSKRITDVLLKSEKLIGVEKSRQQYEGGIRTFNHFFAKLPKEFVAPETDIGTRLNKIRTAKEVFQRGLEELSVHSMETVLDLIAQNSLYRGVESKKVVSEFLTAKKKYDKLTTQVEKDVFCWNYDLHESIKSIRNTMIGTLLIDLSADKDIADAVGAFEFKAYGYKRPTALVTKEMIAKAQKTITELGLMPALERRYAELPDISINNILYADRTVKSILANNVFEDLANKVADNVKNYDKVETVTIEKFISDILPKADKLEAMLENRHSANLVSLITAANADAKNLFKWNNPFSWSYTGDNADSIKERVKAQGGAIDGDLRCSLSWFNFDDLDLHMIEPSGYEISFRNRGSLSPSQGKLDVDMNAGGGQSRSAVENITYADRRRMKEGIYKLVVHNFYRRETVDVGFEMEVEFDGNITTISYSKPVANGESVVVAEIEYKNGQFKIVKSLPSTETVKEMWGLTSQKFHKCSVVMLSPNFWDEQQIGNKHYFFMLEGCRNEDKARGYYNEFLHSDLDQHRKVMEMVGAKMKTDESPNQLSGLGFSVTQKNSLLVRVSGSFNRVVKVVF